MPELHPHIVKALDVNPRISYEALKEQFEKLVLEPLSTIQQHPSSDRRRIVILIDALDECEQEQHVATIIRLLSRSRDLKGISLRIFVTSRPELPIRLGFQEIDANRHQDVALQDIPESIVDHDLRAFLQYEFSRIQKRHSLRPNWPDNDVLQALVEMARPLFIFAATVCRFVANRRLGDPRDLLARVLTYQTTSQASKLGGTYFPVLNQLLIDLDKTEREEVVQKFRQIVGTIVILVDPLSCDSLARLLDISPGEVSSILDFLHSVLKVPPNRKAPISLFHLSFRDFLVDKGNHENDPFWIDEKLTHKRIAAKCISLMSKDGNLKQNICDLEFPGKRRSQVKNETVETGLPPEMRYACRYWALHLKQSASRISDQDDVHKFLHVHLLHLLEALSLLSKISESISMIEILQSLLSVRARAYVTKFALTSSVTAWSKPRMHESVIRCQTFRVSK
jgi:hypothetical protein